MANPVLTDKRFGIDGSDPSFGTRPMTTANTMSRGGVLGALCFFGVFLILGAVFGWSTISTTPSTTGSIEIHGTNGLYLFGSMALAFVVAMIIAFKPKLAKTLGLVYALAEGFALGAISAVFNVVWPGIVLEAVGCTITTFVVITAAYGFGLIKVNNRVVRIISMATFGALLFYLGAWVASLVGFGNIFALGGWAGIGISLVLCVIAAANLLSDFFFVDSAIAAGVEKDYNWYGAFGIMITLIWLYLNVLRLLAMLRS